MTTFHTISLFGPVLHVPEDYNVRFFRGDLAEGVIQLTDLRAIRLELRWRKERKPDKALETLVKRLEKKHELIAQKSPLTTSGGPKTAYHFDSDKLRATLAAADGRVFELHWPLLCDHRAQTATHFLNSLAALTNPSWRWQIYGIDTIVPRHYTLTAWQMLPGRTTLSFADPHPFSKIRGINKLNVGAFSMAERLLQKKNLTEFAIDNLKPPRAAAQPKAWQPKGDTIVTTTFTTFLSRQTLTVEHDRAANRILYHHQIASKMA